MNQTAEGKVQPIYLLHYVGFHFPFIAHALPSENTELYSSVASYLDLRPEGVELHPAYETRKDCLPLSYVCQRKSIFSTRGQLKQR